MNYSIYKSIYIVFHFITMVLGLLLVASNSLMFNNNFVIGNNTLSNECNLQNLNIENCLEYYCNLFPNELCNNVSNIPMDLSIIGCIFFIVSLIGIISVGTGNCIKNLYMILLGLLISIEIIFILIFKNDVLMSLYPNMIGMNETFSGEVFDMFECCGYPNYNQNLNYTDGKIYTCDTFPHKYCLGCQNYTIGCEYPLSKIFTYGTIIGSCLLGILIFLQFCVIISTHILKKYDIDYESAQQFERERLI